MLNDRARRLIGKTVTVVDAVDRTWRPGPGRRQRMDRARRPAAAGERVRIIGVDGNCLKVEPVPATGTSFSSTPSRNSSGAC